MTERSVPEPRQDAASGLFSPFVVTLPAQEQGETIFSGSLSELAAALRGGRLLPSEVPLLDLVHAMLDRARLWREHRPELLADLLAPMGAVIALKARLLLPRPQVPHAEPEEEGELYDDFIEDVEALAELDVLVTFLSERRRERAGLIPAPPLDLGLPRRERKGGSGGLAKLVKAARNAVREVSVPLLARERLTLQGALQALRAYASRLRHFVFGAVPTQDWGERTTYFAALLEGVKGGEFAVSQQGPYGPIEVECLVAYEDGELLPAHAAG